MLQCMQPDKWVLAEHANFTTWPMKWGLMGADLTEEDVNPVKPQLADNLFHQVPVGVGGKSDIK